MIGRIVQRAAVGVYQIFHDDRGVHFRLVRRLPEDNLPNNGIPKEDLRSEHRHLPAILAELE